MSFGDGASLQDRRRNRAERRSNAEDQPMAVVRYRRRAGGGVLHVGLPELADPRGHAVRGGGSARGGGLSWQIIPRRLPELLADPDLERAQRVMRVMLEMKKIEIAELERAAA
jgi:hypothetical protein